MTSSHRGNRLQHETSPYLLQHAHNPVDWYPWGDEAFAKAAAEGKPIFLSVGYSACHWCHVMERESFENPAIAAILNEHFVCVKVDREERPDVDQVYMAAVQAISGHGGWPMSVFLTPDRKPFFAGTYYPPADARGMPGFPRVLAAVSDAWSNRRDEILGGAQRVTSELQRLGAYPNQPGALDARLLDQAFKALERMHDARHGGFGDAPKFPHPMDLKVLLREFARTGNAEALAMARLTLEKMARGGIYDHLGGGFARYSTDARWLVPHFEKMLYDNALLGSVYLEAYQATGETQFAEVARETLDYVLSRMTDPRGGVYSTEDADSEGVEGKYYVWTPDEVAGVLGPEAAQTFCKVYDVSSAGNWEGRSILNLPKSIDEAAASLGRDASEVRGTLKQARRQLLAAREKRVSPGKDTKMLVAWNGMMIAAWAAGARILRDERYLEAARAAARFMRANLSAGDGRLWHTYKDGRASVPAFLDDYACLIDGLTRLFEASGERAWLDQALELANVLIADFQDPDDGGFFYSGKNCESLIVRGKDALDNATPSGNGMAATALLRLAALTGRDELQHAGERALQSARGIMLNGPSAAGQSFVALDFLLGARREIAVIPGADPSESRAAVEAIAQKFLPHAVVAPLDVASPSDLPLFEGRDARGGPATVYVCESFACQAPIVGLPAIRAAFGDESAPG